MRAGYTVAAIDGFADVQTHTLCSQLTTVPFDAQGFKAEGLLAAVKTFDLTAFVGMVYGSGFEAQPELLQELQKLLPILGNDAAVVAQVKNPDSFFAALKQYDILHPDWYATKPKKLNDLLIKAVGGSGGAHIRLAEKVVDVLKHPCYFQQQLAGEAVSVLFIANQYHIESQQYIEAVGFNLQWTSPTQGSPFRFGGAASNADLLESIQSQLLYAAELLTQHFGLQGLNSLDALFCNNDDGEQIFVLELNPRLSATIDLYADTYPDLFERHIRSCQKRALTSLTSVAATSNAMAIVYAEQDLRINADFVWPAWVKDQPQSVMHGVRILGGEPICSVHGVAMNAWAAKQLVEERSIALLELLKQQN